MSIVNVQDELLCAIELGDLSCVKRVVNGVGLDLNTVLHSSFRHENATVLGTAALEGQVEILAYLLDQIGCAVNYKDPLLHRTALHWSCIGGHPRTAQLLLQAPYSANVNSVDKYQATPIICATLSRNLDVVQLLISYGADVLQRDRLRSSALHYATVQDNVDITSTLIRSGCIANDNTVFGTWTPLMSLWYRGDKLNCHLLVNAGYQLNNDQTWIQEYRGNSSDFVKDQICEYLHEKITNTNSLEELCRNATRLCIGGVHLNQRIAKLPLPRSLIAYVQLQ